MIGRMAAAPKGTKFYTRQEYRGTGVQGYRIEKADIRPEKANTRPERA